MDKLIAWMKTINRNLYIILIAAGGYIGYLAYDIFTNVGSTQGSHVPLYIASAVFAVFGVVIVAFSLFALIKGYHSGNNKNG